MRSTAATAWHPVKRAVVLVGLILAAAFALAVVPMSAQGSESASVGSETPDEGPAVAPDTPGGDQESTPFYFSGIIRFADNPVAGVTLTISGNGFEASTITNAEGRWRLYVPAKDTYVLTVNEETLPEGVIVDADQLPPAMAPIEGTTASFEARFGLTNTAVLNLFLSPGERITTSFIDQFVERLINGLNFGLLLALAAVGVSLIFGTTGLTNFAHAEMLTFGAILALVLSVDLAWPLWIALPIVVVLGGLLGWTMDAGLWQPLRRKGLGLVQLMIVSIGLSLAARYVFQFFIGGGTSQLPGAGSSKIQILGPVKLSYVDMVSMAISAVLLVALAFWLLKTRIGKATRAISDNPGLAAASGINVDRVIRIVWILAGSFAAIGGVLWAYFRPGVKWDMGMHILLLIFAAVVLGGLGTAFGALIGAIIVGILVEMSTLFGVPPDLKYIGALAVLIIILLIRPQGILGRKERLG